MLHAETIQPEVDPRWQEFVARSPTGHVFHHVEWLRLLRAQYRYPLIAHCVTAEDGQLVAGLPFARVTSRLTGTRLVAVPFSDSCPVLVNPGDQEALDLLLDSIRTYYAGSETCVEIRAPIGGLPSGERFYRHELALEPGIAAVQGNFSKNAKRGVARARRAGVEVHRATDAAALSSFYRLHLDTRRRQGVPTQPKRFIGRFAGLFERDLGFVLLARSEGRPIAAAVFLHFNGVLTYKYGASNPSHLDKRPNHAVFDEAIRWGCEQAHHTLDFGRTDLDNEGLRSFKRSWGAQERELGYTRIPAADAGMARNGVPPLVSTLISRTPPLTGRLIGAALYRHFG